MGDFTEIIGTPFTGLEKERLQQFLKERKLDYDESITYSYVLMDQEKIAATGSCTDNIIKCVAVAPDYQGQNLLSGILTNLVTHFYEQGIIHYFGFTKPENKDVFEKAGLYPVAETKQVLLLENRKNGLWKYLDKCRKETDEYQKENSDNQNGNEIGAVVVNCNPFTEGHRYLIECAAAKCQWLHIFVLADHGQMFDVNERFEMVRLGTADLQNVILHKASDYMISPMVFPTYFIKDKKHAFEINCELDIEIFGRYIAPALQIKQRYIGSEPFCEVTGRYNECLKKMLPDFQIKVEEIQRKKTDDQFISASVVREKITQGDEFTAKAMLPETSSEIVTEHFYQKEEGLEVSLEEMLRAREERVALQRRIQQKYRTTLVCFTLNIPGPVKTDKAYKKLFLTGKERVENRVKREGTEILSQFLRMKKTGYEWYLAVKADALEVKKWMTDIEEEDSAGRIFDIDVLQENGKKVTRTEIGMQERRCFLCGKTAHICSRNRTHTVKEMTEYIKRTVWQVDQ